MEIDIIEGTQIDDFFGRIISEKLFDIKTPILLEVCNKEGNAIISVTLDAVDSMNFSDIALSDLTLEQQQSALKSLQLGLKKYGGKKSLFPVQDNITDIVPNYVGVNFVPAHPPKPECEYFEKLLYFSYSQHPKAHEKFIKDASQIDKSEENIVIITNEDETNRKFLTSLSDKFSELFNRHTTWGNGPTYTPMGISHRINNPNVIFYAAFRKNNPHEPISCARMHHHNHVYYFGDFVVHANERRLNHGKHMLEIILDDVPAQNVICLIAGGDVHAKKLYEDLGFENIAIHFNEKHQAIKIGNNYSLMSGLIEPEPDNIAMQYQKKLGELPFSYKENFNNWMPTVFKMRKNSANRIQQVQEATQLAVNDKKAEISDILATELQYRKG